MPNEIRTSLGAAMNVGAMLWGGTSDCLSFRLRSLSAAVPVSASADHDGRLANMVVSSLENLTQLIEGDIALIRGIDSTLRKTDARIGAGMLGSDS